MTPRYAIFSGPKHGGRHGWYEWRGMATTQAPPSASTT